MRSFGRATRDWFRDLREGSISIYIDVKIAVTSTLAILLGAIVRGLNDKYTNVGRYLQDQGCPALDGQVHDWITNMGNFYLIIGVFGLSLAGIIPKLFKLCQLRDEAICCGQIFMGLFGKISAYTFVIFLLLFNGYGTFLWR